MFLLSIRYCPIRFQLSFQLACTQMVSCESRTEMLHIYSLEHTYTQTLLVACAPFKREHWCTYLDRNSARTRISHHNTLTHTGGRTVNTTFTCKHDFSSEFRITSRTKQAKALTFVANVFHFIRNTSPCCIVLPPNHDV